MALLLPFACFFSHAKLQPKCTPTQNEKFMPKSLFYHNKHNRNEFSPRNSSEGHPKINICKSTFKWGKLLFSKMAYQQSSMQFQLVKLSTGYQNISLTYFRTLKSGIKLQTSAPSHKHNKVQKVFPFSTNK